MTRTFRLVISYDGTEYLGWQIQPNGPSIQQELTKVIEEITGTAAQPIASGRTDSGVHAQGQVASLTVETRLDSKEFLRALNALLPDAIVIREMEEVDGGFDAIRDAKWKLYRYVYNDGMIEDVFSRRFSWRIHRPLDIEAMRRGAVQLLGKHDFRCFERKWPNRATSVRTVRRCDVTRMADFVYLDVEADGFLYNMVRAIAGTLCEVGRGKWPSERVGQIVRGASRTMAGPTAPPHGLFLIRVEY